MGEGFEDFGAGDALLGLVVAGLLDHKAVEMRRAKGIGGAAMEAGTQSHFERAASVVRPGDIHAMGIAVGQAREQGIVQREIADGSRHWFRPDGVVVRWNGREWAEV